MDCFPRDRYLVCKERHQVQYLRQYRGTLDRVFEARSPRDETWLFNTLAKSPENVQRTQTFQPKSGPSKTQNLLDRLPAELIEEIIDLLLIDLHNSNWAIGNILALGLSSPRLWSVVLGRIHRNYKHKTLPSWAGEKLAFQGSVPPTFASPELLDGVRYTWKSKKCQPDRAWTELLEHGGTRWNGYTDEDLEPIKQDLSQTYLYPQDRVWILRNLTKRQLVRSDKLQPPPSIIPAQYSTIQTAPVQKIVKRVLKNLLSSRKTPTSASASTPAARHLEPLTLAQIFIILASYSDSRSNVGDETHEEFLEKVSLNFRTGPWINDAFDVVTLEEHLRSESELDADDNAETPTPWMDVSDVAVADVANLRWCARIWAEYQALGKVTYVDWRSLAGQLPIWQLIGKTRAEHQTWRDGPVI